MPTTRVERAPAKLTRTLQVEGVRPDGYHLLRSEMVALDVGDELEIEPGGEGLVIEDEVPWSSGTRPRLEVPDGPANLVRRALEAIGESARVVLRKRVPPGAGLGGGSADAAAVLRAFGVGDVRLAATLGADVPFCLAGRRALVGGIGEDVAPLPPVPLGFVLVTPGFGVSTKAVYAAFDELGASGATTNDLEPAALAVEGRLGALRDAIAAVAGRRPSLAGSGSTYFLECPPAEAAAFAARVAAGLGSNFGPLVVRGCGALTES